MAPSNPNVVVVIGVGGIGLAIARRIVQGRKLLISTRQEATLTSAAESLRNDGHDVSTYQADITSYDSISKLAETSAALGTINAIVLTSGVAPTTAKSQDIYAVDLIGTVNVIDAFLPYVGPGTSLVCLSSSAAYMTSISPALTKHLATAPRESLLDNPELQAYSGTPGAYPVAKRGNIVRVQASAKAYGLKGARLNSVSPGFITSPMGNSTLENSSSAANVKHMLANSALGRAGTVEDIANAVEFLVGHASSYVSGIDILVDGGTISSIHWPSAAA